MHHSRRANYILPLKGEARVKIAFCVLRIIARIVSWHTLLQHIRYPAAVVAKGTIIKELTAGDQGSDQFPKLDIRARFSPKKIFAAPKSFLELIKSFRLLNVNYKNVPIFLYEDQELGLITRT